MFWADRSPHITQVIARAYARALYLLPTLESSTPENTKPRLDALVTLSEVVRSVTQADHDTPPAILDTTRSMVPSTVCAPPSFRLCFQAASQL